MKKKQLIFRYFMILSYCLWCGIQLYLLFSGNKLSGQGRTFSLMASRKWMYTAKLISGGILYLSFILDSWIVGYHKNRSIKKLVLRMVENVIILLLLFILVIACNYMINSSMSGYMNYFEPMFVIVQIMLLSVLFGISLNLITRHKYS